MTTDTDAVTDDNSLLEIFITYKSTGLPVDLTGKQVKLYWFTNDSVLIQKNATIENPVTDGRVTYPFIAGDIIQPSMQIEVKVIDDQGVVLKNLDLITLKTRKALSA